MFSIAYLASIVTINIGFMLTMPIPLSTGDVWPPMSLFVGLVFVLRDYAQREIGHRVLLLMVAGAALSYYLATPAIAAASLVAYLISETLDWALYTFSSMSFTRRVALSSIAAAPIDSVVFLFALDAATPLAVALMTVSKLIGIAVVLRVVRARGAA